MKKALVILLCLLLAAAMPSLAEDGPAAKAAPAANAGTLDEQLQALYRLSLDYGTELESGGWDISLTCEPAEEIPEDLLPGAEETEVTGRTADDFRNARFIALYNDAGTIRLLGDYQARIPESMRAASLAEANAVLYLKHYLELREDYLGTAYNRVYKACVYFRGEKGTTEIYEQTSQPPFAGRGVLTGDPVSPEELWNGVREWFYGTVEAAYPEGTAVYRITGKTCALTELNGSFTVFEVPAEAEGYPVTAVTSCTNDTVEELVLPEGIATIGTIWCEKLTRINFPSTLKRIAGGVGIKGESGFMPAIESAELNEGLGEICDYGMTGNTATTSFVWPSTLLKVGEGFLESGLGVPYVIVPEGVSALPDYFLRHGGNVCCVYIPASVGSFGSSLCDEGRIRIYTPEGSPAAAWADKQGYEWVACASPEDMPKPEYRTENDFTYVTIEGEAVIRKYTGKAKKLRVPDTLGGCPVAIVSEDAFYKLDTMQAILFPDTVRRMDEDAIYKCRNLKAVFLPASITEISSLSFDGEAGTVVYAPAGSAAAEELSSERLEEWKAGAEKKWFK